MAYFANNNPTQHRQEYNDREWNTDPYAAKTNGEPMQHDRIRYNNTVKSSVMRHDAD